MANNSFKVNYYYDCKSIEGLYSGYRLEHRNPFNKPNEEFVLWYGNMGRIVESRELAEKQLRQNYKTVILEKERRTMTNTTLINKVL